MAADWRDELDILDLIACPVEIQQEDAELREMLWNQRMSNNIIWAKDAMKFSGTASYINKMHSSIKRYEDWDWVCGWWRSKWRYIIRVFPSLPFQLLRDAPFMAEAMEKENQPVRLLALLNANVSTVHHFLMLGMNALELLLINAVDDITSREIRSFAVAAEKALYHELADEAATRRMEFRLGHGPSRNRIAALKTTLIQSEAHAYRASEPERKRQRIENHNLKNNKLRNSQNHNIKHISNAADDDSDLPMELDDDDDHDNDEDVLRGLEDDVVDNLKHISNTADDDHDNDEGPITIDLIQFGDEKADDNESMPPLPDQVLKDIDHALDREKVNSDLFRNTISLSAAEFKKLGGRILHFSDTSLQMWLLPPSLMHRSVLRSEALYKSMRLPKSWGLKKGAKQTALQALFQSLSPV